MFASARHTRSLLSAGNCNPLDLVKHGRVAPAIVELGLPREAIEAYFAAGDWERMERVAAELQRIIYIYGGGASAIRGFLISRAAGRSPRSAAVSPTRGS